MPEREVNRRWCPTSTRKGYGDTGWPARRSRTRRPRQGVRRSQRRRTRAEEATTQEGVTRLGGGRRQARSSTPGKGGPSPAAPAPGRRCPQRRTPPLSRGAGSVSVRCVLNDGSSAAPSEVPPRAGLRFEALGHVRVSQVAGARRREVGLLQAQSAHEPTAPQRECVPLRVPKELRAPSPRRPPPRP